MGVKRLPLQVVDGAASHKALEPSLLSEGHWVHQPPTPPEPEARLCFAHRDGLSVGFPHQLPEPGSVEGATLFQSHYFLPDIVGPFLKIR